ncbi:hypothetical protein EsH8_XIII_000030 [Colletotrichum jinshuiense]
MGPRVRLETERDISRSLGQLRQAQSLHAEMQTGRNAIPAVWADLRQQFWHHAWRRYIADPVAAASAPDGDVRDFAAFLRVQLNPEQLDYVLFVVFTDHRARLRDPARASAELRRRYAAFRGNVAGRSEDDCALVLGTTVLASISALKNLNSLLNPRAATAPAFPADDVFAEVTRQVLARHRDAAEPPEPTPADVAAALIGEPPAHPSGGPSPPPRGTELLTRVFVLLALRGRRASTASTSAGPTPTPEPFGRRPAAGVKRPGSPVVAPPPARRLRLSRSVEDENEDADDELAPPPTPPQPQQQPQSQPQPQPKPQPEPEPESEPEPEPEIPRRATPRSRPDSPEPLAPPPTPSAPSTTPPPPDHGIPIPGSSSPVNFQTPPPASRAAIRRAVVVETERWKDIARQVAEMPEPQGSVLWRLAVGSLRAAAFAVGAWCDQILDEDALESDEA